MKALLLWVFVATVFAFAHEFAVVPHDQLQPLQEIELSASRFDVWTLPPKLVKVRNGDPDLPVRNQLIQELASNQCEAKKYKKKITTVGKYFGAQQCPSQDDVIFAKLNFVSRDESQRTLANDGVQWFNGNEGLVQEVETFRELGEDEKPTPRARDSLWFTLCAAIVTAKVLPKVAEDNLCESVWLRNDPDWINVRGVNVPKIKQQSVENEDTAIAKALNCKTRSGAEGGNAAPGIHQDISNSDVQKLIKEYPDVVKHFYNVWIALEDITASPLGFGVDTQSDPRALEFRAMKAGDFVVFNSLDVWHVAMPIVAATGPNCRSSVEFRFSYIEGRKL